MVATSISGIPLAVEEGVHGRLVPEQDATRLVDALLDLLSDPDAADSMGKTGRKKAVAELSWDSVAARYRDAYLLALESAPRHP